MPDQLSLFQTMASTAKKNEAAGPPAPGVETPGAAPDKPLTPKARMKMLIEELRFAQMQVRLDISGLARSKAKAKRIAAEMRKLQCQKNLSQNQ